MPDEKRHHDFRVISPEAHGRRGEVWMDGKKLKGVKRFSVYSGVDELNIITIELIAGSLNADGSDVSEADSVVRPSSGSNAGG